MKIGRIKKKALLSIPWVQDSSPPRCALCQREIIKSQLEQHHLIPKSKGGVETVALHSICHRQIHALFNENELANHFHSLDKLLEHPDISKFIHWIQKKPIDYKDRSRKSNRLKSNV